jgi:hypothetical protein
MVQCDQSLWNDPATEEADLAFGWRRVDHGASRTTRAYSFKASRQGRSRLPVARS